MRIQTSRNLFQMAKRKIDCSLDDIVAEYFKKRKYEKSCKLYIEKVGNTINDQTKMLEKFFDYVKIMEIEKENKIDEDLDFEIDFGAYQIERKVSLKSVVKICGLSISKLYLSFHRSTSTNRISKVA